MPEQHRGRGAREVADGWPQRGDYVVCPGAPRPPRQGPETPPPPLSAEFIALRHDWVRSVVGVEPDRLLIETDVGHSMQPGIQDGDLLFVDGAEDRFRSYGIYVLEIAGERLVETGAAEAGRRPDPDQRQHLSMRQNTSHPPQATDIHVVGRVVWVCGPTRGGC